MPAKVQAFGEKRSWIGVIVGKRCIFAGIAVK
ncbi:hypothetical protein J2736_003765 [Paenibacillus qinlingensis]|uniref:Uncharacterized protein n=1 Tax=Paenibacillus qinlingensis TaxID=1837343 RepID=A0ABU1NZ32_9BACL|nr:hypothetical protein [Paenibacillus qinlingensis]